MGHAEPRDPAWLWHALDDNLFSDPDKWATPQWKAYGTLCASFRDRARTPDSAITPEKHGEARKVSMEVNEFGILDDPTAPHTSLDRLADRLMGKLAEILDEAKAPSTYENSIRFLANSAMSTDLNILRAWDHIMVVCKSHALENYDDIFGRDGDSIDLVVSPGIFQSGRPKTGFYEGLWAHPIRVAVKGELEDATADFRSFIMKNTIGSRVAST
ncbi:hypothetical protein B0T26DRAFT_806975 [Lasiosphaeria miniovina]|uniref:Uncharacterized protein n=1 Tax=Lasiosphaeria miniovina TaxID=1954250 RepID=A0AA40DH76_9PEZI|nr:uncharacterized protein B0T26DRAFT_806975 [Lasiosphaeria miniovina]KAK0703414.1 hypothetical protein B0T26DRAFT_806975 [Lasiosphaeria miniovina]